MGKTHHNLKPHQPLAFEREGYGLDMNAPILTMPALIFTEKPPPPLLLPAEEGAEVVITAPHGGRAYPSNWASSWSSSWTTDQFNTEEAWQRARSLEDTGTDIISAHLASKNRDILIARSGRALCDLNRPENAIDPLICTEQKYACDEIYQPYIAAGYGVIPRLSADRQPIYAEKFSTAQTAEIIKTYHKPYHQLVQNRLAQMGAHRTHGLLCDLHSMPNFWGPNFWGPNLGSNLETHLGGEAGPDFVFGNLHGKTLNRALVSNIDGFMRDTGYSWRWNYPYAGGFITRHYGMPMAEGRNLSKISVLQIEVNRASFCPDHLMTSHGTNHGIDQGVNHGANHSIDRAKILKLISMLDALITCLVEWIAAEH